MNFIVWQIVIGRRRIFRFQRHALFLLGQVKTDFSSRIENEDNEGESFLIFVFFCEKQVTPEMMDRL
jgi:hypothetical protein